jgi:diguanylate cyclase (GGDEF)-like protein
MNATLRAPPTALIRVLLVDSEQSACRLIMDLLDMISHARFHVTLVRSFAECRDRLAQNDIDICLLDLSLPNKDSFELLTSANVLWPALPIIVIAEAPTPEQDKRAQSLGADALLEKDKLDPASLERTIRYARHQRKVTANMARHAFLDDRTGLISAGLFRERLDRALAFARRRDHDAAVMVIDLDFEGQREGDVRIIDGAICKIGQKLAGELRETDSLARLSERRLALLAEGMTNLDQTAIVARKVMRRLRSPIEVDGLAVAMTPSMGVAIYPREGGDSQTLLREAEAAMHRALAEGGGRCRFSSEHIDDAANEGMVLAKAFASAFDHRELRLRLYPDIAFAGGMNGLCGEVAWRHPDKGWRLLSATFSAIEDEGLIEGIVNWALASAAEQLLVWERQDVKLRYLSLALPFDCPPTLALLKEAISKQVADKSIPSDMIELDLPLSLIINDARRGGSDLAALKATGVRLAIDSFGDSRFAIDDLQQHAIDRVKLSPRLCAGLADDRRHVATLRALINLGHDLGLNVTAKGARDQRQLALLKRLGCDSVQLSTDLPAMSADAARVWLRTTASSTGDKAPIRPLSPEIIVPSGRPKSNERAKSSPSNTAD